MNPWKIQSGGFAFFSCVSVFRESTSSNNGTNVAGTVDVHGAPRYRVTLGQRLNVGQWDTVQVVVKGVRPGPRLPLDESSDLPLGFHPGTVRVILVGRAPPCHRLWEGYPQVVRGCGRCPLCLAQPSPLRSLDLLAVRPVYLALLRGDDEVPRVLVDVGWHLPIMSVRRVPIPVVRVVSSFRHLLPS